ncbi:caspase family protein [bacterium AH-315-F18]|nr:caspase family protein [bacterium AH-315-F18]
MYMTDHLINKRAGLLLVGLCLFLPLLACGTTSRSRKIRNAKDSPYERAFRKKMATRGGAKGERGPSASAPLVAIQYPLDGGRAPADVIEVRGLARDDKKIQRVEIYANGKKVGTQDGRGLKVAPRASDATQVAFAFSVSLEKGRNTLRVVAYDVDGLFGEHRITVERPMKKPRLFALIVGINKYKDPSIPDLRFAENDARAMAAFLREETGGLVQKPEDVRLLLGPKADQRQILWEFEDHLEARATNKDDIVVFFFAGHGFNEGDDYYLAAHDTERRRLGPSAVERDQIQKYWGKIRAETKLFIADACHAGGLDNMRSGENRINEGLQIRGKGSVSILSSQAGEESCEDKDLGHGVFTYSLLAGLRGAADRSGDQDGVVTIREVIQFIGNDVPRRAKKLKHDQRPLTEYTGAVGEIWLSRPR